MTRNNFVIDCRRRILIILTKNDRLLQSRAPCYIEISTIHDFGRLVCAFERTPLLTFSFNRNEEHLLATHMDFISNIPPYLLRKISKQRLIILPIAYSGVAEEVIVVDSILNPAYIYSPIISIEKFPKAFSRTAKIAKNTGYVPIKLKDLSSLAKVASSRMNYDESPLPLFVFKSKASHVIGTTVTLGESDSIAYFYYVTSVEEPLSSFIKYSSQKNEQPTFSNNIHETWFNLLKARSRLASTNPLVTIYE